MKGAGSNARKRVIAVAVIAVALVAIWLAWRSATPAASGGTSGDTLASSSANVPTTADAIETETRAVDRGAQRTTVVTIDASGARVGGIDVFEVHHGAFVRVGTTNASGALALVVGGDSGALQLLGVATRLVSDVVESPRPPPDEIALRMRACGTIAGTVTSSGGPVAGKRVLVSRGNHALDSAGAERLLATWDPRACAVSRDDGSFAIHGLDPDERYLLWHGGLDVYGGVRTVMGDEPGLALIVTPLFGAIVEYVDEAGALVKARDDIYSLPEAGTQVLGTVPKRDDPGLVMAGIPREAWGWSKNPSFVLQAVASQADRIGPARFGASLFGYEPLKEQKVWLPRLSGGLCAVEHVKLTRITRPRGTLEIALMLPEGHGVDGDASTSVSGSPCGELSFESLSTEAFTGFRVPVTTGMQLPVIVADVPQGRYEMYFEPRHRSYSTQRESVLVGDGVNSVQLDLREHEGLALGSVELRPKNPDGSPYEGVVIVVFYPSSSGRMRIGRGVLSLRPPYRVCFVPMGTYRISVAREYDRRQDDLELSVSIAPGEKSTVDFQFAPRVPTR